MTTYADAFRELCDGIGFDGVHSAWLYSIFRHVAEDWCGRAVGDGPGFPCGITAHGDPFECSVSLVERGPCALRFIAQPCGGARAASAAFGFLREHPIFAPPNGSVAELAEFFIGNLRDDFRGTFTSWVGASIDSSGNRTLKVYLNPWAVRAPPTELLTRLLALGNFGEPRVEALLGVLAVLPRESWMSMLGLNLPSSSPLEAKTYFVVPRISGRDALTRLAVLGAPGPETVRHRVLPPADRVGELHVAATCSRSAHGSLNLKLNYRGADFFVDDADALARAHGHRAWSAESLHLLGRIESLARDPRAMKRRVTFLGVGERKCDVYLA